MLFLLFLKVIMPIQLIFLLLRTSLWIDYFHLGSSKERKEEAENSSLYNNSK